MSNNIQRSSINNTSSIAGGNSSSGNGSWFEAMADAWGKVLDAKADAISTKSAAMDQGQDKPADVTQLTAMSMEMSYLSNASHTALAAVGSALETMARKQ